MTTSSDTDDVSTTLSLLRDAVCEEEDRVRNEGIKAMQGGEYNTATTLIGFAQHIRLFQDEVETLIGKWGKLEEIREETGTAVQAIVSKRYVPISKRGRPPKGTKGNDHCHYILEVLVKMGGCGSTGDVSAAVNKIATMRYPHFKAARVMIARNGWVKDNGSSRILEISANGRRWLEKLGEEESLPSTKSDARADVDGATVPQEKHPIHDSLRPQSIFDIQI